MTGGAPPSAVANISGSTLISPSCRFQYVHIGRFRTTSPDGVVMSIRSGIPRSDQNRAAHGPGATTTCSPTSISPALVSTAETVPSSRDAKPVTSTPSRTETPSARHLSRSPSTDSTLNAKPPWCSCRQIVTPCARQSGKSAFMCASTSASPAISSER